MLIISASSFSKIKPIKTIFINVPVTPKIIHTYEIEKNVVNNYSIIIPLSSKD